MSDDEMFNMELSKVETHLKENLNSIKAVTRPKENDDSIEVETYPKENVKSIKVVIHPNDYVESSKTVKSQKEKSKFRKRNRAAYQVPNHWEELYEKDEAVKAEFSPYGYVDKQHTTQKRYPSKLKGALINKRVTDIISDAKDSSDIKKPDYYTSAKEEVKADLKFAHDFGYINTRRRSSRWNKKHLDEIERDKREIESWFESGIVYKAVAPEQTRLDPDSDGIDPDAYEEVPQSKEITLGDYISTIPVHVTEIDNFDNDPSGEIEKVFPLIPFNCNQSNEGEIHTLPSHPDSDFKGKLSRFRSRCKYYHQAAGTPYPGCCGESESSDEESETSLDDWNDTHSESASVKSIPEFIKEKIAENIVDYVNSESGKENIRKYNERKAKTIPVYMQYKERKAKAIPLDNDLPSKSESKESSPEILEKLAQKVVSHMNIGKEYMMEYNKRKDNTIPLCKHGYMYHVQHFADSIYFEADHMMELMPRKRLYDFAEAMRVLSGLIENLRSDNNRKLYDCQPEYCLWNMTSNKDIRKECMLNTFSETVTDSISFEIRVKQVNNPRYGLRTLLKDSYDPTTTGIYSEYLLGLKHNKALDDLESHKLLEFKGHMDRFTCLVFEEVSDLQTIMKTHGFLDESKELGSGLNKYHSISWKIERQQAFEKCSKLQCCGPLFRSKKTKDPNIDSDFESGLSINIPVEYEQISTKSLSRQMKSLDVVDSKCAEVPVQYCPTLLVECFSPRWQYQSGKNINKSQDLDLTNRGVADGESFTAHSNKSTSESIDEVGSGSFEKH